MAQHSLFVLKVPLNTIQPTNQPESGDTYEYTGWAR